MALVVGPLEEEFFAASLTVIFQQCEYDLILLYLSNSFHCRYFKSKLEVLSAVQRSKAMVNLLWNSDPAYIVTYLNGSLLSGHIVYYNQQSYYNNFFKRKYIPVFKGLATKKKYFFKL